MMDSKNERAHRAALVAVFATSVACVPPVEGAPVTPSSAAPDAPRAADIQVVTPEQAARAGLTGTPVSIAYPDDSDGTTMVGKWLAAARRVASDRVGSITIHIVRAQEQGPVECQSVLYPKDTVVPVTVPAQSQLVSVPRPVQRPVMHLEQRCQLVSKPHMRMETTYTSQYDSFSKSYRSVPQTRTVTDYQMENECRLESVSRMETQWEYGLEWHYTPPRTEFLDAKQLRETEPTCQAVQDGAGVSRVEGLVYRAPSAQDEAAPAAESTSDSDPPYPAPSAPTDWSTCRHAFQHLPELAQAWAEWHPDRAPKPLPSRMEFLAVCHDLSKEQQACLVMPSGRTNRATCAPYFDALAPAYRERLDGLFLAPR
jgi:hypothetical protein